MAITDNTALFRARCKIIKTRQNAFKMKEKKDIPESISPSEVPSSLQQLLIRNSHNFRIFASQAREILRNISELRNLVVSKRREYVRCSGGGNFSAYGHSNFISDYDCRQFDNDSHTAMRQCGKLIKSFKSQIETDVSLCEDELKHLKCVIQLLSVYLKEVCKIVAQLREIHLKKTQKSQRICRLANLVELLYETNSSVIEVDEEEAKVEHVKSLEKGDELPLMELDMNEKQDLFFELNDKDDENHEEQDQLLLIENVKLYNRFAHSNTRVQRIETQMAEIKRLQDTFDEKVLEQQQEIEQIHVTTTHTLDNLEAANDFILQAIKNSSSRRVVMLFCLIVLTFTLLFLDWYNT